MPQTFSFLFEHPIVSLFLLTNLLLGFWVHRKAKLSSFEDYALASRMLPTGVLVMTLLATRLGSVDLANAGFVFEYGILEGLVSVAFILSFFFTGTFITPFFVYFEDCMTLGDIMERLYGRGAKVMTGLLSCIFSIMMVSAQVKAVGLLSTYLLGVGPHNAILWCGGVAVLYSVWGGMRSVSYTDALQVVIALGVLMFVTQTLIQFIGGGGALWSNLPADKVVFLGHPELHYKLTSVAFWGFFPTFILTPPIVQRMLMIKDKRQLRKVWYIAALLYSLFRFLVVLIGLGAIVGWQQLGLDGSSHDLLPRVISGLFVGRTLLKECMFVGFLGILLSTMDSYLHAVGVVMVQDLMIPLKKVFSGRNLSKNRKVPYARIGVGFVGCIAVMFGFFGSIALEDVPMHRVAVLLFNLVLIPLLIGLVGVKTDTASWVGFCVMYLSSTGLLYVWGQHIYMCFLAGVVLGVTIFFLTHYISHGGFVMLQRSEHTITEQLWIPGGRKMAHKIVSWFLSFLHLPALARDQLAYYPSRPLVFSLFMFMLYTFSSVTTGVTEGAFSVASLMGLVHMIGMVLCFGLLFERLWPTRLSPYFALYWYFTLLYCLPFGGTLVFLKAHVGIYPWVQLLLLWVCLLVLVSTKTFIVLLLLGVGMACKVYSIWIGPFPWRLWQEIRSDGAVYTALLIGIAILFFKYRQGRYIYRKLYLSYVATRDVGHEVRDPLAHISGLGYVLERAAVDGKVMKDKEGKEGFWFSKERYAFLENHAGDIVKRVKEVGKELSHFSDIIKQQLLGAFVEQEVGVRALVEEAIEQLPEKYSKKVHVSMECLSDFEAKVLAGVFPNVILHLVKNAYLHGEASEVAIKIDGEHRVVHVRDNGRGIAPEVLPRIFDLFYRTNEGSGVGLSLVKMIIEASGGKVSCYSKYGGKRTFTDVVISLP